MTEYIIYDIDHLWFLFAAQHLWIHDALDASCFNGDCQACFHFHRDSTKVGDSFLMSKASTDTTDWQ